MNCFAFSRTAAAIIFVWLGSLRVGIGQTPAPANPGAPSPLQVLAMEGPNASRWALAPLERMIPPDIRENLTLLKESVADEAKAKPVGTVAAYQAAYRLCTEMIAVLDERDLAQVRAGFRTAQINNTPLVTSQALEARRSATMSWPQFAREQNQRSAIEQQATNNGNVAKEGLKVHWAERAAQLRPAFDTAYAQFREALRATPALLAPVNPPANTTENRTNPATQSSKPPAPGEPAASPPVSPSGHSVVRSSVPNLGISGVPPDLTQKFATIALDGRRNTVLGGPDPGSFTADEMKICQGLKFSDVQPPANRGFAYFYLDTFIENSSPQEAIENELSVEVRILCADARGKLDVIRYTKKFDLKVQGWQHVGIGGDGLDNNAIRTRNDNDVTPRNLYAAFKLNGKIFREVLLSDFGGDDWWRRNELVSIGR